MELVNCSKKYWNFVRILRADKRIIRNFVDQSTISEMQQITFMKLNSEFFKICLIDDNPVGYIGLIGERKNEITLCVIPEKSNLGIGSYMLSIFQKLNNKTLTAKVKKDNISSSKVFLKNGFREHMKDKTFIHYIYENDK